MRCLVVLVSLIAVVAVFGCGGSVAPPEFDGRRAYRYLEEQVAFGPRVPGFEAWNECRDYYRRHFVSLGLEVDSQVFSFTDPYTGVDSPLVNIIVHHRGNPGEDKGILLVAHWDTRPRTDFHSDSTLRDSVPIAGANDGASGVAVLMELANMIAARPPKTNVDLLLADGEDWGKPGDNDFYCMGSRHFARQGIRDKYYFGLVIDMIGDKDQQIFREVFSDRFYKPINDMVWRAAAELGVGTFRDRTKHQVIDDHLSLCVNGVPAVDIIDFDYPAWHTEFDTPDKCSAEALTNVGRVIARIIYDESLWPKE